MNDAFDRARDEFFSEAQEIIETLSRNLLSLDAALKAGREDPALVNEAFRGVHTLKGLAGLFGVGSIGALAHRLEDLLDSLRLGRVPLDARALDLLFQSVEVFGQLLGAEKAEAPAPTTAVAALIAQLDQGGAVVAPAGGALETFDLDPGVLAVLTEYEEHRLRTNVENGLSLYRLRVQFDLLTIDRALEEMKDKAKRHGEVITYLPTGESASPDSIELDLMLASRDDLATLVGSLGADNVVIEQIGRRNLPGAQRHSVPVPGAGQRPELLPVEPAGEVDRAGAAEGGSLRSVTQTVRVDIRKLDLLMNVVGELAIVRSALSRVADRLRADGQRQLSTELFRLHRSFDRRLSELQDGILEVRMVPLGQVFDRLARVVRQISRELGKDVRLIITGAETEIDKLIVEELSDPLMHMIRNAIDHGIESAEERKAVGKPASGTIALNAFQKGSHVVIEIEDDGRGIDHVRVLERAVGMGMLGRGEAEAMARTEALGLVFHPGLSTRTTLSDTSGRGVGMDVVKTNIARLGGIIDVESEAGIGTKFTVTLPITLAIVSALMITVGEQVFAIPLSSVAEAIAFDGRGVRRVDGREVMTLRGQSLPLCRLDEHLALGGEAPARRFVVVVTLGARRVGLVVDHLIGQQDVVIKPLGRSLSSVRGFSGATELGDQRVSLVLDTAQLVEEVLSVGEHQSGRLLHG